MNDLKPCPFCGSKDISDACYSGMDCYIMCDDCGASGPSNCCTDADEQEDVAIEDWNKRAELDNTKER